MLRHQNFIAGSTAFLTGRGEMAERIAQYEWARHSFGAIESWPQSLRSALSICLQSRFPTAIYWGPELRLLYNDAWAPIPGPRHPAALGARAEDVWADIWHEIEPQFREVIQSGEGIFTENRLLPMARFGAPEETYWSYSFTPIRGEDGQIAGIFNSGWETTQAVLAQRQMRFFLDLSELLRRATDLTGGWTAAIEALGRHMGVAAATYADLGDSRKPLVLASWSERDVDPAHAAGFLHHALARLQTGDEIAIIDANNDSSKAGESLRAAGWEAAFAIAMVRTDTPTALFIAMERPRSWNAFDKATLKEMLERLEAFRQRLLAEEREDMVTREVDHRARNAMTVAQSIVSLTFAEGGDDVRDNVRERLASLGRSQALLSAERWRSLDFAMLIAQELAPFPHIKATTGGPPVPLQPSLAQTLSLVVHELATNSVKYGAMGHAGGEVSIVWRHEDNRFEMDWTEGIPARAAATASTLAANGTGFGTTLIERVVRGQLRGQLQRQLNAQGFSCHLQIPLAQP